MRRPGIQPTLPPICNRRVQEVRDRQQRMKAGMAQEGAAQQGGAAEGGAAEEPKQEGGEQQEGAPAKELVSTKA